MPTPSTRCPSESPVWVVGPLDARSCTVAAQNRTRPDRGGRLMHPRCRERWNLTDGTALPERDAESRLTRPIVLGAYCRFAPDRSKATSESIDVMCKG